MSEQPPTPLPVDDGVIVKLPEGTVVSSSESNMVFFNAKQSPFDSTKTFANKVAEYICGSINPKKLFQKEINAEILETGRQWKTGKICCRVVFEFIPNELENDKISGNSVSSLDELRKMNL